MNTQIHLHQRNEAHLTENKRCIAAARTLLFNFGQGMWTPHNVFFDCCKLLECKSELKPIPDFQPIEIPISFFSKQLRGDTALFSLCNLYSTEGKNFLSLPSTTKLNWLRNFTYMQELLFNFSFAEHQLIFDILQTWNRPSYDYNRIAFQTPRCSNLSGGIAGITVANV